MGLSTPTRAAILAPSLALACLAAGCTAVSGVNDFKQPGLCDLDMQIRGFGVHETQLFEARAVTTTDELSARFIIDPMGTGDIDFRMPRAIDKREHRVDFFADDNDSGEYDDPGAMGDHTWQVDDPCTDPPVFFEHKFDFTPLPTPAPRGDDFSMTLVGMRQDVAFELRVVEIDPELDGPDEGMARIGRTVGLFRTPAIDEDPLQVDIPGVIQADRKYLIAFWADGNDDTAPNGTYDAPPMDEAWRLTLMGSSATDGSFERVEEYFDIGGILVTPDP